MENQIESQLRVDILAQTITSCYSHFWVKASFPAFGNYRTPFPVQALLLDREIHWNFEFWQTHSDCLKCDYNFHLRNGNYSVLCYYFRDRLLLAFISSLSWDPLHYIFFQTSNCVTRQLPHCHFNYFIAEASFFAFSDFFFGLKVAHLKRTKSYELPIER